MYKIKVLPEEKIKTVEAYLEGTGNHKSWSKKIGVRHSTFQGWVHIYENFGPEGLMEKSKASRYSTDTKQSAVEAYLSGTGSQCEICKRFGIFSRTQLQNWIKLYNGHKELRSTGGSRSDNGTYGYRRLADEYNQHNGTAYNDKRFYRLAQLVGLKSVIRRKRPAYQRSTPGITAENILGRDFTAEKPNEKWLTDVTEMKYGNGEKLYLSAILDLKSRDIVSFAIGKSNNNQLVFDTFDMAVWRYPNAKPLFHSDRGIQYTSKQFKAKLDAAGMAQSMSRVGRCIDNGPMEGFWGILKCKMYYLQRFESCTARSTRAVAR